LQHGFFDFENFDVEEYEHYEVSPSLILIFHSHRYNLTLKLYSTATLSTVAPMSFDHLTLNNCDNNSKILNQVAIIKEKCIFCKQKVKVFGHSLIVTLSESCS